MIPRKRSPRFPGSGILTVGPLTAITCHSPFLPYFCFNTNTFPMDLNMITFLTAIVALLIALYSFYLVNELKKKKQVTNRQMDLPAGLCNYKLMKDW